MCTGTPQGLAANSTWARGQAWATYGFTMAYRYTKNPILLGWAKKTAEYYLQRTTIGKVGKAGKVGKVGKVLIGKAGKAQIGDGTTWMGVPAWDYDAVAPNNFPDTSAAAITASALLELAQHTSNSMYKSAAYLTLKTLVTKPGYLANVTRSPAVLASNQHDCGTAECTVIESDYFLLEGIRKMKNDM